MIVELAITLFYESHLHLTFQSLTTSLLDITVSCLEVCILNAGAMEGACIFEKLRPLLNFNVNRPYYRTRKYSMLVLYSHYYIHCHHLLDLITSHFQQPWSGAILYVYNWKLTK